MGSLGDLLESSEFQLGFVLGMAAAAVVVALQLLLPDTRPRRRGLVGPAWVVAVLLATAGWFGLPHNATVPWHVPVALGVIFVGADVSARTRGLETSWLWRVVFLIPGAAILAFGQEWSNRPIWLPWLVFLGVSICSPLVADFDRRSARLGLGPVLFAVSLAGVFAYLPENDLIRALLGAALPLALLGIPFRLVRLGEGGAAVALGLYFWSIAVEANDSGIQSWITIFALGLLIMEPIGRRYSRPRTRGVFPLQARRHYTRWVGIGAQVPTAALQVLVVLVDVALVLFVCRVAGFSERFPGDSALPMVLLVPVVLTGIFFGALVGLSPRFRYRSVRLDNRGSPKPRARYRNATPSAGRRRRRVSAPVATGPPR